MAQALEGGVLVMEELDKDILQPARLRGGSEKGADPAVVGAEAAPRGFGRGVEGAHLVGGGDFGDEGSFSGMERPESPQWAASTMILKNFLPRAALAAFTTSQHLRMSLKVWNSPLRRNSMCQVSMQLPSTPAPCRPEGGCGHSAPPRR